MKYALAILLLFCCSRAWGAAPGVPEPDRQLAIQDYGASKSLGISTRYLTQHAVPPELQESCLTAVRFVLPQLSPSPVLDRQKPVGLPGSELQRLDLTGLQWTEAAWAKAFNEVYSPDANPLIVRADVLLAHTFDASRQSAYYDLLYSARGKPPANLTEFFEYWQLDLAKSVGRDRWTIIEAGASGVASHDGTRLVEWRQGPAAYAWLTKDSKETVAEQDPTENLVKGPVFDAGEAIVAVPKLDTVSGDVGSAQVYLLINAQQARVDQADANVVAARNAPHELGPVISTPGSCMLCHAAGILPLPGNALRERIQDGQELYDKTGDVERRYLSILETEVARNQEDFETYCRLATGKTPAECVAALQEMIVWYRGPLGAEQQARELGVTVEEMKLAVAGFAEEYARLYPGQPFPIRLTDVAHGRAVPRVNWEDQTFLQVYTAVETWRSRQ